MAENDGSTTVEIQKDLHKRVKIFSVARGISVKDLIYKGMSLYMDDVEDPENLKRELDAANLK